MTTQDHPSPLAPLRLPMPGRPHPLPSRSDYPCLRSSSRPFSHRQTAPVRPMATQVDYPSRTGAHPDLPDFPTPGLPSPIRTDYPPPTHPRTTRQTKPTQATSPRSVTDTPGPVSPRLHTPAPARPSPDFPPPPVPPPEPVDPGRPDDPHPPPASHSTSPRPSSSPHAKPSLSLPTDRTVPFTCLPDPIRPHSDTPDHHSSDPSRPARLPSPTQAYPAPPHHD
jgi:hypothetical protein